MERLWKLGAKFQVKWKRVCETGGDVKAKADPSVTPATLGDT